MTATEPTIQADIPPELADHPRYRVHSQLGIGGMGVVYKAEHLMMGRTVAVKVMAQKYTANAVAVERFRREVRAAAKLAHPNIVTAFDADEAAGRHFLVMEYVEGVSLDRVVNRRGPLPLATACHVARMVALGLQHAHAKGMIHRDIKPQNVMVNRKSQVKILDFGLARLATDSDLPSTGASAGGPENVAVTATNMVVGTPDYLSPEQAMAKPDIDYRSDIYSLGCLFYFALTARPPFAAAKTVFDKVLAQANDEPPPVANFRRDVPDELLSILHKMMAKNPAERYASASEVAAALLPFTKPSSASDVHLVAAPTFASGSAEEFGFADTSPAPTDDVAATVSVKRALPGAAWKTYAVLAGLIAGLLFLLLVLAAVLNPPKRDHAATPPATLIPARTAPVPPPTALRVLFVLPKHGLHLDDYEPARARLVELGDAVTTTSTTPGLCGLKGLDNRARPHAEIGLGDVRPEEFDAILFTGTEVGDFIQGPSGDLVNNLLRTMNASKKAIGAISVGQQVLLQHRLMRNKSAATPTLMVREKFNQNAERLFGVKWDAWRRVVTDGNIVTASGSDDAKEFADAVHAAILQQRAAK